MFLYKSLGSQQRQLGKTSVIKVGAYIVSLWTETQPYTDWKLVKSEFSWETTCADKIVSNFNSIFARRAGFLLRSKCVGVVCCLLSVLDSSIKLPIV